MSVESTHPDYDEYLPLWQRNKDAAEGERAVKKRTVRYLPIPDPETTKASSERYLSYLTRAVYTNFTGRTIKGLTGAVFRQDAHVELPSQIEYLIEDANSAGLSLQTIAHRAVSEVIRAGRFVMLADFPESQDGATLEDTAGLQALIACYDAESLINWREDGGRLTLAVLMEQREEVSADGFTFEPVKYYRVLRLTAEGATIQLYRESEPANDERVIKDYSGKALRHIPLTIVGSEDNNAEPDNPPISDIAGLNLAHYRNSADYEEGVFIHGQPTLHINCGDTDAATFSEVNGTIMVGSREGVVTQNGGMNLIQADPNNAAMTAMEHKETQMVRLGAQIIADSRGQETAEAARIRSGAETSVLNTIVRNVSEGIEDVLRWCCEYMGANPLDATYKLNDQFYPLEADPALLAQIMMGVDRQAWPVSVMQDYARKAGLVGGDMTNEDLTEQARLASPYA